jgi:hypothetical protein
MDVEETGGNGGELAKSQKGWSVTVRQAISFMELQDARPLPDPASRAGQLIQGRRGKDAAGKRA